MRSQLILTKQDEKKILTIREEHRALKDKLKELEARKKQLEELVKTDWLGKQFNEIISPIGVSLVTLSTYTVLTLDQQLLASEHAKIYDKYLYERIQQRLTIK